MSETTDRTASRLRAELEEHRQMALSQLAQIERHARELRGYLERDETDRPTFVGQDLQNLATQAAKATRSASIHDELLNILRYTRDAPTGD